MGPSLILPCLHARLLQRDEGCLLTGVLGEGTSSSLAVDLVCCDVASDQTFSATEGEDTVPQIWLLGAH